MIQHCKKCDCTHRSDVMCSVAIPLRNYLGDKNYYEIFPRRPKKKTPILQGVNQPQEGGNNDRT